VSIVLGDILRDDAPAENVTSFFDNAIAYVDALAKIPPQNGTIKTNLRDLPAECKDHSVINFVHALLFTPDMPLHANRTSVFGDEIELGHFSPEHPFPARSLKGKIENIKTELFALLDRKAKVPGETITIGMSEIAPNGMLFSQSPAGHSPYSLLKDLLAYHDCNEVPETGSRGAIGSDFEQTVSISRKALEKLVEGEKDGISIAAWRK